MNCGAYFTAKGYEEIILPALWEQQTFVDKAGKEILGQMYTFNDKKDRPICLIPEATAIVQQEFDQEKNKRLFYVARCYRYERPQKGRYREFTQFGVELLNGDETDREEILSLMKQCLDVCKIDYQVDSVVKRGLDYYVEDGFEARCEELGAQKQVAGGGRYKNGIGFAIGIDRVLVTKSGTDV